MKVSYSWLQNYFQDKLPEPEKLAELLTFHVFEIESLEKTFDNKDTVLDVKVLPDRACYALSHKGIAYEIAAITGQAIQEPELYKNLDTKILKNTAKNGDKKVNIKVENSQACLRYMARFVSDVKISESPSWLKEKLEAVGQRSINTIVDATNFVMLDIGQPLHAFDADKVSGNITVRFAKVGEQITTLDNKEVALDNFVLVIADDAGPLAIAGIKGGNRAAVTEKTKNIILESANFDAGLIRKITQKVNIKTDSSKRFENNISPEYAEEGVQKVSELISKLTEQNTGSLSMSDITDIYTKPITTHILQISSLYITERLGIEIPEKKIEDIFLKLKLEFTKTGDKYELIIPSWRRDLTIPEDIVEEVGRIYGYDKIPAKDLPEISFKPKVEKSFYYENKIKDILVNLGFSEVYTYTFQDKGEIELEKSLASDKNFLRSDLMSGIQDSLELNTKNADLLGLDQVKIFEIGAIFEKSGERKILALGVKNAKKLKITEKEILEQALEKLKQELNLTTELHVLGKFNTEKNICEVNLDEIIEKLPEPASYPAYAVKQDSKKYQPFSLYPFSVRDIAVFTPEGTEEKEVNDIIEKNAGSLLVRNTLFDVFTKKLLEGSKTSYAFRLVLQSQEKTLTEDEINSVIKKITDEMNSREGWQVR